MPRFPEPPNLFLKVTRPRKRSKINLENVISSEDGKSRISVLQLCLRFAGRVNGPRRQENRGGIDRWLSEAVSVRCGEEGMSLPQFLRRDVLCWCT